MKMHPQQEQLLGRAETHVQRFIKEHGEFSLFGLVLFADGRVVPVQPTDEFPDEKTKFTETLATLYAMAQDSKITATVLCTPMEDNGEDAIVYDLEQKESPRVLVVQPYREKFFGGWHFGRKEVTVQNAKLFASNPPSQPIAGKPDSG